MYLGVDLFTIGAKRLHKPRSQSNPVEVHLEEGLLRTDIRETGMYTADSILRGLTRYRKYSNNLGCC